MLLVSLVVVVDSLNFVILMFYCWVNLLGVCMFELVCLILLVCI